MGFSGDGESRGRKTAGRAKRVDYCRVFGAGIEERARTDFSPERSKEKGADRSAPFAVKAARSFKSYWTVKSLLETGVPLSEISTL
jgi:hypothetical protein